MSIRILFTFFCVCHISLIFITFRTAGEPSNTDYFDHITLFSEGGITVGEIWHYLNAHEKASAGKITQELKKTERMACLGIDWVTREGKLNIEKRQRVTYFTLNIASTAHNRGNATE